MTGRALILGAAGFMGSHLARRLLADGWEVTGLVRSTRSPEVERRLGGVLRDLPLVEGDCADGELLRRLVTGMDAVLPFAGRSGAARSLADPISDLMDNVVACEVLLEALVDHNPGARVVVPGSRLQYGQVERLPVDEDHPCRPISPYGLHKLVAEQCHLLHHRLHGLPVTCLRISNPYGAFQDRPDGAFGVVGTFLRTAARGAAITLYSGGHQCRDYLHIDDLTALVTSLLVRHDLAGNVYNVGGDARVTLREMAEAVVRTVGGGSVVEVPWPQGEARVETGDYVTDLTRIRDDLGWRPRIQLEEGLARTWEALAAELGSDAVTPAAGPSRPVR